MRIAEYCDVLKLLRDRPATANELAQMFEIKPSRAREWLQELAAQGLVDEVGEDTARGAPGRRSVLYVLAAEWTGPVSRRVSVRDPNKQPWLTAK